MEAYDESDWLFFIHEEVKTKNAFPSSSKNFPIIDLADAWLKIGGSALVQSYSVSVFQSCVITTQPILLLFGVSFIDDASRFSVCFTMRRSKSRAKRD